MALKLDLMPIFDTPKNWAADPGEHFTSPNDPKYFTQQYRKAVISLEKSLTTSSINTHISGKVGPIMISRFFLRASVIFTNIPGFMVISDIFPRAMILHSLRTFERQVSAIEAYINLLLTKCESPSEWYALSSKLSILH